MISVQQCLICDRRMQGRPKDWPDWPFCSPRCRLIDLGRWLGEQYRLPGEASDVHVADDEDGSDPL